MFRGSLSIPKLMSSTHNKHRKKSWDKAIIQHTSDPGNKDMYSFHKTLTPKFNFNYYFNSNESQWNINTDSV